MCRRKISSGCLRAPLPATAKSDAGVLVLRHTDAQLLLDAQRGGAIREFSCGGRHVLRPTSITGASGPMDMACFPMVPYVNRIAAGRFQFGGRQVQLAQNWTQDPHPLHGEGWRSAWTVKELSAGAARLQFEGGGDEWPWRYRAEQRFTLEPNGLAIELSAENLGTEPMPVMLGLHPYFYNASRTRLRARLPRLWRTDQAALPLEEMATPADWGFEPARPVTDLPLDHCFAGWDGVATLSSAEQTIGLQAGNCSYLHIYVPAGRDFFCLEPLSAAAGALGRGGAEVQVVPPGERRAISLRITAGAA
jgi:aldose 1-epimerase